MVLIGYSIDNGVLKKLSGLNWNLFVNYICTAVKTQHCPREVTRKELDRIKSSVMEVGGWYKLDFKIEEEVVSKTGVSKFIRVQYPKGHKFIHLSLVKKG